MTNPSNPSNPNNPFQWSGLGSGSTTVNTSSFWQSQQAAQQAMEAMQQFAANTPQPAQSVPSAQSSAYEGLPGHHYFEENSQRAYFETRRLERRTYNQQTRPGPNWTEQDEHKLVDALYKDWFGEPYPGFMTWDFPDLNLDKLEAVPLRRKEMPPFKINYDTYNEIKLRLLSTAISVKGHPFVVKHIKQTSGNKFDLALYDGNKTQAVRYDDLTDLRSIPALYVSSGNTGWLCRSPGRVYQQGMNRNNTVLRAPDGKSVLCSIDATSIVQAVRNRQNRKWEPTLASLMIGGELSAARLTDDIAMRIYSGKILACYRGRVLGRVQGNEIKVEDEDDLLQEWIEKPVRDAGLEMAA